MTNLDNERACPAQGSKILSGLQVRKRATRWGIPEYLTADDLRQRIIDGVEHDTNGGCWLWPKNHGRHSYASVVVGRVGEGGRVFKAHRLSYSLFRGEIPEGMSVMHKCDVPCCINPDHLAVGTHAENMADMARKRRSGWHNMRGGLVTAPKLNENQVAEIRALRAAGVVPRILAERFGVQPRQIRRIVEGTRWR